MDFIEQSAESALGPLNQVERKNAPRSLFMLGDVNLLKDGPRVSLVGSRKASAAGLKRAFQLAKILAENGVHVVSGLAEGIDTAAHTGAMEAGGRTIGVIGTPLNQSYPASNRELQAKIAEDHLLVSQFPIGSPGGKKNFPMRNRTMALISDATVIVEAQDGSGSLHQGWEALRLGRPLFIMESILADTSLEWPKEMLRYGAQVLNRDGVGDLIESLPKASRHEIAEFAF
jgi:DNA processing protein